MVLAQILLHGRAFAVEEPSHAALSTAWGARRPRWMPSTIRRPRMGGVGREMANTQKRGTARQGRFELVCPYQPTGDQPAAIATLSRGIAAGKPHQTLLGITGSGKTFTMAAVIEQQNRPTLVLSPNKTLAAQLYSRVQGALPEERGRVLRQLLRLLPARGLRALERHVHREGRQPQREPRAPAQQRHALAARAPRRADRGLGLVHLRSRFARRTTPGWRCRSRRARRSSATSSCAR